MLRATAAWFLACPEAMAPKMNPMKPKMKQMKVAKATMKVAKAKAKQNAKGSKPTIKKEQASDQMTAAQRSILAVAAGTHDKADSMNVPHVILCSASIP